MITLFAVLAIGAAQAAAPAPEPAGRSYAALAAAQPESVVVDCAVGAETLTDCKVVGEAGEAGPDALLLAVQIPAETARSIAVAGRVTIRLTVNP
jgi:hypothetical protein